MFNSLLIVSLQAAVGEDSNSLYLNLHDAPKDMIEELMGQAKLVRMTKRGLNSNSGDNR